jgi:hypothetical protein
MQSSGAHVPPLIVFIVHERERERERDLKDNRYPRSSLTQALHQVSFFLYFIEDSLSGNEYHALAFLNIWTRKHDFDVHVMTQLDHCCHEINLESEN